MSGRLRRILIAILILAAVVAIAYQSRHKIHLADFTWNKFVASVGQANIFLLFLCLVGIYGCYALRAVRWQRFCKYVGPTNFLNTYAGTLMGFAAIFVLGRAGEPVRPLLLARKERLPVSSLFGIFFLERFCDFAAAAALACLSLLVFPNRLSDAGADMGWVESARHGGWLLLAAMTALIVMLVVYRLHGAAILDRILARWRDAGGFRSRFASGITGISEGLQAIRTTSDLLAAIFYTAAHWVLATLIYLGVAKAFGASFMHSDMNFSGAMLLLAVTLVGSVLQLPGVGGGAQIASFIGLTKIFGVEQEPAAAMAVVLWLITFAGGTLAGIPLLIHEGMSVGELRQLARAEAEAEESGKHIAVTENNGVSPSSRAAKAKPLEEKP
ncbi:MAG TPA: lysylphosphatidylglycerol synthase transmembrane domain-containing protein [Candidatus Acidoferrales bacterium]|nr:lysylphosphatidylglycerol synthase transmembrane domain-containing protein [Candidatus Acidoferrales bacterium]